MLRRHKLRQLAAAVFCVMALVGTLDMAYQASMRTSCGPIRMVLSAAFPNAAGACHCGDWPKGK